METIFQDVRYTIRQMAKSPGFFVAAVFMLALGIGANTAIFSVINTVLLKPLPYAHADSLARIWGKNPKKGVEVDLLSPADVRDVRSQDRVFEDVGFATDQVYNLTNAGNPESLLGYQFSANFFQVLGVNPLLGRTFVPGEDTAGHDHVVVLGHRLWRKRFGGNHNVVGTTVTLNDQPYTVIGVMPPEFYYPVRDNELWTPLVIPADAATNHGIRFLRVLARLKPGVSMQQAQVEVSTIAARIAGQHPDTNAGQSARVISIQDDITSDIRPALWALMGAVGFVLLIACSNVANLSMARATRRHGEIAVRAALGASNGRLLRQFLTESIVLSLLGGVAGVVLAAVGVNALVAMFPSTISNLNIPRVENIPIDSRVLAFAVVASIATGILFGLAPALRSRIHLSESLKNAGKSFMGRASTLSYRNLLVVSEIALSLMLMVGAGLLSKSFLSLLGKKLGFNSDHLLSFRILTPETKYVTGLQQRQFMEQISSKVLALPGVSAAGAVTFLPLSGWNARRPFTILGRPADASGEGPSVSWAQSDANYFHTMEIPTLRGRMFSDQDTPTSPPVALISESMAHKYWPKQDPLGQHILLKFDKKPVEIVGVVADVRQFGAGDVPTEAVYVAYAQGGASMACFVVRTPADPMSLATAVQQAVWSADKDQPVSYLMTMEQLVTESLASQRVLTYVLGAFAALALILATVGTYSVMAYGVVERTHEIGLRMALGAARGDVLRLIVGRGMFLAVIGLVFGLLGSLWIGRFLVSLLYGVGPIDLRTYALVSGVLAAAAYLACYLPARRASRVDPMVALRYE